MAMPASDGKLPRSSLDLHNLTGVLGLPFHFVITLSGLIIFFNVYFPTTADLVYAESENPHQAFQADLGEEFSRPAANLPGKLASLEEMARAARESGTALVSGSWTYLTLAMPRASLAYTVPTMTP